ncbi:hypothetical protein [Bradyrhizobium sp. Ash2021]|uniref:hypothetical protein n=1 Tax=Bradyrhizobium sp. Ash2021 TaxID=2954771 RepID=UPI002814CC00|nr:hypothetical protein [Bradyrhizobium sp. Ash2021]WMT72003.1 hypothetical protein NL528_28530 [Bradyrhizobium sp. Ash2021]
MTVHFIRGGSAQNTTSIFLRPSCNRQLRRLARKHNLATRVRQINPTGKSLRIFRNCVKPKNQKYSASAVGQISGMNPLVSPDKRGGSRVVTNARWDAVDAKLAEDERRLRERRRRVVLAPEAGVKFTGIFSRATVATEHGSPGRARYKP